MKAIVTGFVDTTTKPQRIAGYIYLPLHIFIIPLLLSLLSYCIPDKVNELTANILYYALGLLFCLILMRKYLRRAFDILLDNIGKNFILLLSGYFMYFMLSYIVSLLMLLFLGDGVSNPNNEALIEMSGKNSGVTIALAVFIAPIVEEVLFRGIVFGSIRGKSRGAAYILSISVFALYHVWQYALAFSDTGILLYALQYIPAGYALAWSYEKTNCIWISIFLHMVINIFAVSLV